MVVLLVGVLLLHLLVGEMECLVHQLEKDLVVVGADGTYAKPGSVTALD